MTLTVRLLKTSLRPALLIGGGTSAEDSLVKEKLLIRMAWETERVQTPLEAPGMSLTLPIEPLVIREILKMTVLGRDPPFLFPNRKGRHSTLIRGRIP